MTYRYHGELIRLGSRLERLPNDEDLEMLREEFRPYAALMACMPKKNDLITIASRGDVLWRVDDSAAARVSQNRFICHLYHFSGYKFEQHHTDYLGLMIALDEGALEADFLECVNKTQALHTDITIVGQVTPVTAYARVPDLPREAAEALDWGEG